MKTAHLEWDSEHREGVEGRQYECSRAERALKAVRRISLVQIQYSTLTMKITGVSFNKTNQMFLCNLLNSANQMELLPCQQIISGQCGIQRSISSDIIKEKMQLENL